MKNILQNQKKNFFKIDKEQALKDIKISIKDWHNFQDRNFFSQIFSKQKKSIHWEASNLMLNLFHVHLKWSRGIIRSQTNIKKEEVLNVLIATMDFYSQISSIKADITHPDIIRCYNYTAKKNNLKQKRIKFKDKIEINFFDPFNNVRGKEMKNLERKFSREKTTALKSLQLCLQFINQLDNKLERFNARKLEKPSNLIFDKRNSTFEVKFLWCGKELESYKNLKKIDVKKKLNEIKRIIIFFDILRPNVSDIINKKMYECLLTDNTYNFFDTHKIKRKIYKIKGKFNEIVNILKLKF